MTDSLTALQTEWDTIQERASHASWVEQNKDAAHREHNAANAQRLREGKPPKISNLLTEANQTLQAVKIARPQIVAAIIEQIRVERGEDESVTMQTPETGTGEQIVARVRERFDARERTEAEGRRRVEGRAQYEHDIAVRERCKVENRDGTFSVVGLPNDVKERLEKGEYGTAVPTGRMPEAGIVQPMPRPKVGPPIRDKQPLPEPEPIEITDEQRAAWEMQARENAERRAAVLAGEHAPVEPPKVVKR